MKTPRPAACERLEERRLLSGSVWFLDQEMPWGQVGEGGTLSIPLAYYDPSPSSWTPAPYSGVYWHGPVTITYSISGQASANDLIAAGSYTIPAWTQYFYQVDPMSPPAASFRLAVQIAADNLVEGNESLVITLTGATGVGVGYPSPYYPASPQGPATRSYIIADDPPIVGLAKLNDGSEGPEAPNTTGTTPVRFRVSRTGGDLTRPLSVSYTSQGTGNAPASPGSDYSSSSGSITIPANQSSVDLVMAVTDDSEAEWTEGLQVQLTGGGMGQSYVFPGYDPVSNPNPAAPVANAVIYDNDTGLLYQGLPEESTGTPNETSPGGTLTLNDDDDNRNGIPDLQDTLASSDDDLEPLFLQLPSTPPPGGGNLSLSAGSSLKLWMDRSKSTAVPTSFTYAQAPRQVYVEGVTAGVSVVTLSTPGGGDTVKITVAAAPPVIGLADPAESRVKLLGTNDDDDNGNGQYDRAEAGSFADDDLKPVALTSRNLPSTCLVWMSVSGGKLRVWSDANRSELLLSGDGTTTLLSTNGVIPQVWVEAVDASTNVFDQRLSFSAQAPGGFAYLLLKYTNVRANVSVDSNNNGQGEGNPGEADDLIEDRANEPGKILAVADGDQDNDGIPDYADGFNWDGQSNTADDACPVTFTPVTLSVTGGNLSPNSKSFVLSYSASAPTNSGPASNYMLAEGHYRLWTRESAGNRSVTSFKDASNPGDGKSYYVPAGTFAAGDWAKLAQAAGQSASATSLTLYLEAVRPSAAMGDGLSLTFADVAKDAAKTTAFRTKLYKLGQDGTLTPTDQPQLSHPTPVFSNVVTAFSNLHLNADKTRVLGSITVSGALDDAASDLIAGDPGKINKVYLTLNGTALPVILTQVTKTPNPGSLLKPYDFSATFTATFTDVELQPGVNLFQLSASNAFGFSGFAERSVTVLVDRPANRSYEYELRMQQDPYINSSQEVTIELRSRLEGGAWGEWRTLTRRDFETFEGAGSRVRLSLTGPGGASICAAIMDTETRNQGEIIELQQNRIEQDNGVQRTVWNGTWVWEGKDLVDLSQHTLAVGEMSPTTSSAGGELHPLLMGIDGPAALREYLRAASIGDNSYDLELYQERLILSLPDEPGPRVFFFAANLAQATAAPATRTAPSWAEAAWRGVQEVQQYQNGAAVGFLDAIKENVVGLYDGAKFVLTQAWEYFPPKVIYRLATTGDPRTVEDQRRWEAIKGAASTIATIIEKLNQDGETFVQALQTGDVQALNQLGGEYRVALEFAAEMLGTLWDTLLTMPAYDRGKIAGRIVGEVVLTVAPAIVSGGATAVAKGVAMLGVTQKLRQISYVAQAEQLIVKLDRLVALYQDLDRITDEVETLSRLMGNVRDGRKVSEMIASVVLRHKQLTGEGYWKSFEAFLDATASISRRARVDSRLGAAASYFTRQAYKESAELIRAGRIEEGLAAVPSYNRVVEKMAGRRAIANLEAHHAATKQLAKVLGVPEAQLDTMPSVLMNKYWHQYNSNIPDVEDVAFHKIQLRNMDGADLTNRPDVLDRLRRTWREFEGVGPADADPDTWVVIEAWLNRTMQP